MTTLPETKHCSKCGETKSTSDFGKAAGRRDGLYPTCKACVNAHNRERRRTHGDEIRAKKREYAARNPEAKREIDRRSYEKHRDSRIARMRANYAQNRERIRETVREAYRQDPSKPNEQNRRYYQAHSQEIGLYKQRHYHQNKPRYQQNSRAWQDRNPGYIAHQSRRRRVRQVQAHGTHTIAEWRRMCAWFGQVCLRCGSHEPLTVDHVVPLSRGGSDDIANIQPLCKSCNSAKHQRTIDYRDAAVLSAFFGTIC